MHSNRYQSEDTYLYSSLLEKLQDLSDSEMSLLTRCLFATFWKIKDDQRLLKIQIKAIEDKIGRFDKDPTREKSRTGKVLSCAIYSLLVDRIRHQETVFDFIEYAIDSGDFLGQPRLAACLSLRSDKTGSSAKEYLKGNIGAWINDSRIDFIAYALIGLRSEISDGDFKRIIEAVKSNFDRISLDVTALLLIGMSSKSIDRNSSEKKQLEEELYGIIKQRMVGRTDTESLIFSAAAIKLSGFSKITGYFERDSGELKEIFEKKVSYETSVKKTKSRNLMLYVLSLLAITSIEWMFYLPCFVEFKDNPSVIGRVLIFTNGYKNWALSLGIALISYISVSYLTTGDPVIGLIEFLKQKIPGLSNMSMRRNQDD